MRKILVSAMLASLVAACGGGGDGGASNASVGAAGSGGVPNASGGAAGSGGGPNASVGRTGSLSGPIQSVDAVRGVLKIVGIAVAAEATTIVVDGRTGSTGPLVLTDLQIGDSVHVDFHQITEVGLSPFLATRIERRNPSTQFEIIQTNPGFVAYGVPYPTIFYDQQTQYFGSCSALVMNSAPQSPAWGPCSGNEFWADFGGWGGPFVADLTVSGAIRQSDGTPVASVVTVEWS